MFYNAPYSMLKLYTDKTTYRLSYGRLDDTIHIAELV